jgi:serine/threonine protein kinase
MAPEFFNSKQYDGPAVDVWALGCMFHEMLFNEIYFIGTTQYEVSMKVMNKPYVIKGEFNCSAEVRDLLPRMIEKDKSKRITAKEIIQHPLFNKAKASPEFIRIMAEEKAYMDKFFWS